MARNRYTNVLPYDHNRVLLKLRDNDYINASWITMRIPDLDTTNIYIATQVGLNAFTKLRAFHLQGALQSTIKDMWELIWQERTPVIVMLTDCLEPQPHTNTVRHLLCSFLYLAFFSVCKSAFSIGQN